MKYAGYQFIILILVLAVAACGSKEERASEHLLKGKNYLQKEDYEKARVEFKNVLQIDPKHSEAMYSMGKVLEKTKKYGQAHLHYKNVLELEPEHLDAIRDLALIYIGAGKLELAQQQAENALRLAKDDVDVLTLNGNLYFRKGDQKKAREFISRALEKKPHDPIASMVLASIHAAQGKNDGSFKIIEQSAMNNPEHLGLKSELVKYYAANNDSENAIALIKEIIDRKPEDLGIRKQLATYYTSLKRFGDAKKVLLSSIKTEPENPQPKLDYMFFLSEVESFETARSQITTYISQYPDKYELQFGLSELLLSNNKESDAISVYKQIIDADKLGSSGLKARVGIAQRLAKNKKYDEAMVYVNEVLQENSSDLGALLVRANIALVRKDPQTAIADFRVALRENPNSVSLLKKLAVAHVQNNDVLIAIDTLKRVVDKNQKDADSLQRLGQLLANTGDHNSAIAYFEKALMVKENDEAVLTGLFKSQLALNNHNAAMQVAAIIKTNNAKSAVGNYLSALVYDVKGDVASSIREYKAALKKEPEGVEPLSALVKLYVREGKPESALKQLNKVLTANPKNIVAQNIKGEVLLSQKKYDLAKLEFETAMQIDPKYIFPYRNLANVMISKGDMDEAERIYKKGIENTEGSPRLTFGLASFYEKLGKSDNAIKQYEDFYQKNPDSLAAANNMAMLLATYKDDPTSLEKAKSLIEPLKASTNPAYMDTVGWVYYKSGEYDRAISTLEQAIISAPKQPLLHYHLGMAYFSKGDKQKARTNLELAIEGKHKYTGKEEALSTLKSLNNV